MTATLVLAWALTAAQIMLGLLARAALYRDRIEGTMPMPDEDQAPS